MQGIKCQLCDGLIVNGRCKTCGMPYRNDEVLYHLNERSRDHYKHATPKAQEMMRQSRVPLGDKAPSSHKKGQTGNNKGQASQKQEADRLMTREQIRAQQEKVRQEAMAKINSVKVPNKSGNTGSKGGKKKNISWFWWILIIFYIIIGLISR